MEIHITSLLSVESTECPKCSCKMSRVVESRGVIVQGRHIQLRFRICRYCHKKFKTKEVVIPDNEIKLPDTKKRKKKTIEPETTRKKTKKPPGRVNPFI